MPAEEIRFRSIDSHTGGEPTRTVVEGAPDLGGGTAADQRERLRRDHDWLRSALVTEPRTTEAAVGALLVEPADPGCAAGVIFFNNVGYLNMCIHGTIGVVETLAYLGRIAPGTHRLETPVGEVRATLAEDGRITVANVPSYRFRHRVAIEVEGYGVAHGDIAWGGNWFFLIDDHGQDIALANIARLTDYASKARRALERAGITGEGGMEIDHIELFAPPGELPADSRNFVLCPGLEYDRSPCGTGTSAKLACLHAAGKLAEGETWRQAGIVGSVFEGSVERRGGDLIPHITGTAHINADCQIILRASDPFRLGIPKQV